MSSDHTTHIHNLKTGTHTNLNGTKNCMPKTSIFEKINFFVYI